MERTPLQDAVDGWLSDGPLTVEELAERAVGAGLVPDDLDDGYQPSDDVDQLIEGSDAYWSAYSHTDDEVVVLASTFVDTGMTFTHRVTEEDVDAEAVTLAPDLSVVEWNRPDGLPLDDGTGMVRADFTSLSEPRLAGPPGWIEAIRPGDLLAVTRVDGVLSVEVIDADELGDGTAEIEALRDAAHGWIGEGRGEEELPVVMEAMAREPKLFRRPVPPVGELLVAAGLERRGHEWGQAGEEWQTLQERFKDHDAGLRRLYGFQPCCHHPFDRVKEAWRDHLEGTAPDGRALAEDLGHGTVAAAFVAANAMTPGAVAGFARAAADTTSGRRTAPALTLLGLAQLRACDAEAALTALESAVRADSDVPGAARALALLELDRGNLTRAQTLAVRDGGDPDLVQWIEAERARQAGLRPSAGRNDPCPCGSGRKYKKCCAVGGPLTLAQRVPLVVRRMGQHATRPEAHAALFGLAVSAAGAHDDVVDAIRRFVDDPFLVDVAVHDGGLGENYLEQRRPLLADDEAALVEAMLQAPRRLWEITAVTPGESFTLRDTGSGDEIHVIERKGSKGRGVGELLLARALAVEGEPMLVGIPIVVPLRERSRVLRMLDEPVDADGLAAWYGSLSLPPHLTNREGEDIVPRRTTLAITGDRTAAVAALDETYERQEDGLVWHETIVLDDHDRILRGVLRLDGDELAVESNSEERQERILATLAGLFAHVIVDDDEIEEEIEERGDEGVGGGGLLDPADMPDEVRAAVEQFIAGYEERWVDDAVPALGGLTPRQALDDPTRREDLFALLREMRGHELPGGAVRMSADRVERLLGIEHHQGSG